MQQRRWIMAVLSCAALVLALTSSPAAEAAPAPAAMVSAVPRPDHVVMLVMENHSSSNIVGNPDAPYLNSLASSGANLTSSFAITHPSQPNYIALFSGSLNGVTDNSCPNSLTAANLGSELLDAGLGFGGYSEDLPGVGYTGCTSGAYARKHNPWVNFSNVPATVNRPLTDFPTDYATLPAVSVVVPNLQHDMHDGSVAQGDTWVHDQLDGYVQWAKQHNSVFILTFDEDDNASGNQIPTIFQGQRVQPGQYSSRVDHYSVLRTIQDAFGLAPIAGSATATPILDIWTPEPNAPQASFTATCVDLTCSVDGSASTAATGSVVGWDWDWGDGATSTGRTASHAYAASGDFTVTLRVTDDQGRTGQTTRAVSPRAPAGSPVFASDQFARTVSSGLGTADVGGAWSVAGGPANYSVSSGAASLVSQRPGSGLSALLPAVSSTDTDLQLSVATNPMPNNNGLYLTFVGRRVGTNLEYEGKARIRGDGAVVVSLAMLSGSATAVTLKGEVVAPGVNATAGSQLKTRLQVVGTNPTTVRWKVWSAATEPTGWQLSTTDSTAALQAPGSIGIATYLSSGDTVAPVTTKVLALSARSTAAPPANQPPVAAFTSAVTDLTATFDATTSSDPDGTVTGYAWDFGDTTTGTGSKCSHPYAAAGTYPVKLTVTDAQGASTSVTHDVTVTAPAPAVLAADDFGRTLTSGWGTADAGGSWTASSPTSFAVSGGTGSITMKTAGAGPASYLGAVSSTDVDLQLTLALDKATTGNGVYAYVIGRRVANVGDYRAKVRVLPGGAVRVGLAYVTAAGAETAIFAEVPVPNVTILPGDALRLRVQVRGANPSTVRAKVWTGTSEPGAWAVSQTDTRAGMQVAGSVGLATYLSGSSTNAPVVARFDSLRVAKASSLP